MKELWKDVVGYEGYYQVSNLGNIKGLERVVASRSNCTQLLKEKVLAHYTHRCGYVRYNLTKHNHVKTMSGHLLVAKAFISNPENKPTINHKDGNKTNNAVSNLEWCTYSENTRHAYKTNLFPDFQNLGDKNGRSKLTTEIVLTIRECFRQYDGMKQLFLFDMAELFDSSKTTILRIVNQTHWRIEL